MITHLPYAIPDDTVVVDVECFDCPAPASDDQSDDGNPRCSSCASSRALRIARNNREASRESALEHRAVMRMEEGA